MAGLRIGEGIHRRKPIEHIEETEVAEGTRLERSLGLWQLTAIGVGGIIGAGIFTLAGTVANGTAGPAVLVISIWLITFLQWQTWVRFAVWFAIRQIVYFAYSNRRSELARTTRSP